MGVLDVAGPSVASFRRVESDQWVPLGYRAKSPYNSTGNFPALPQSNGTNLGGTFRIRDTAQVTGRAVKLVFAHFWNNAGESEFGSDVTINLASIEFLNISTANLNIPFTFAGSPSVVIKASTFGVYIAETDPLAVYIPKGADYYIRVYVTVASGAKYGLMLSARGSTAYGEGFNVDPTTAGPGPNYAGYGGGWASIISSGVRMFAPAAILTRAVRPCSVAMFVTDSIGVGTGEQSTLIGFDHLDDGWPTRAVRDRWPHYTAGLSGTLLNDWNNATTGQAKSFRRRGLIAKHYFTHLICEMGINDVLGGATLAQLQARWLLVWGDLGSYGRPVYQTTLTPATNTSTDSFTTTAAMTPHASASVVAAANDWLRDGAPYDTSTGLAVATGATGATVVRAPWYSTTTGGTASITTRGASVHPLTGAIEVADAVESSRNSGVWKQLARARVLTGATSISSGSSSLTLTGGALDVVQDLNMAVIVPGAGASSGILQAALTGVTDATHGTLGTTAGTTVTNGTAYLGAYGYTADGVHPSGTNGNSPGGHEAIANFVRPQLAAILGSQAA